MYPVPWQSRILSPLVLFGIAFFSCSATAFQRSQCPSAYSHPAHNLPLAVTLKDADPYSIRVGGYAGGYIFSGVARTQSACSFNSQSSRREGRRGGGSGSSTPSFEANPESVLIRRTIYGERIFPNAASMQWVSESVAKPGSSDAPLRIAGVLVAGLAISALTMSRRNVGGKLIVPTREPVTVELPGRLAR